MALAIVLGGLFVADLGSYVFHYLVDHYGRAVPGGVVHEFQRHHLIPDGIARKPLSEVLYPAARIASPLQAMLLVPLAGGAIPGEAALLMFVLCLCWVLAQLCHRWTHIRAPWPARVAQRLHLLVSPREHALHHRSPFESRFAVITGWSNPVCDGLGLPRLLDRLMAALGYEKRGLIRSLQELSAVE